MTLGTIHTRVRRALGKGTSMDAAIVDAVRAAARKFEQNRTYQYMKRYGTVTFDLESDLPYVVDTPNQFKRISLIRLNIDGRYYRVKRGLNIEELELKSGVPSRYELDGTSRLVFNATPDQAYDLDIFFDAYTSWPTDEASTNWLIQNGEEALVWEALLGLSAEVRDPRWRQHAEASRTEALRSLLIADEEMSDSDYDTRMTFTPEGGFDG